MTPDGELLRRYTETNSENAFAELVERHLNLVYSAALRQVNGDAHLAQDVAQTVFADLARKAASLAGRPVLTGWLYTSAHFAAAKAVRTERRRHTREEEAQFMNQLLSDPAPDLDWEKLRPVLDAAMLELNEPDREAVLLRYFDNRPHAEIADRLGLGENAARMRVDRALEKLRTFLVRRGVSTTAALSAVIAVNAVQVAPAGLAATLSTAALAGTTLTTAATVTATKAIAMTTLQKTLIAATLTAAVGTGIYEARQASELRTQVQILQEQQGPLAEQAQQLNHERDDFTRQLAALRDENERLNRNTGELLKLRGEVGLLRRNQSAPLRTTDSRPPKTETPTSKEPLLEDMGRELGMAVVRGEPAALQKVLELANAEHESFKTNSAGLNDTLRGELGNRTFAPLRAAFDVIAEAASKGNQLALDAVAQATQIQELNGLAIQSLGTLAGTGNNEALEILLNREKYGFLLSSTVGALQPAAENGNQKAIEALAAVTRDADQQALWFMAATSLTKAAESGNSLAIDTLIALSGCTNSNAHRAAVSGLKQAAANQNAKAAEALRSLGVQ